MESESYEELCQRRAELEEFLHRDFDINLASTSIPPNHWDYVTKEAVSDKYSLIIGFALSIISCVC